MSEGYKAVYDYSTGQWKYIAPAAMGFGTILIIICFICLCCSLSNSIVGFTWWDSISQFFNDFINISTSTITPTIPIPTTVAISEPVETTNDTTVEGFRYRF